MNSMTGMGRARGRIGASYFLAEIKSINHRYCEVYPHLAGRFQSLEHPILQLVKKRISRGKVDVTLLEEKKDPLAVASMEGIKKYHLFLKRIQKEFHLREPIGLAHLLGGAAFLNLRENDIKRDTPSVMALVEKALVSLLAMRRKEGAHLAREVGKHLKNLKEISDGVESHKGEVLSAYQIKLKKRIETLAPGIEIDPARLAAEVAVMADRSDISEELERLKSHYSQASHLMKDRKPCGRSIDFLIQEMNREWNTVGSKSQDASMAHLVVKAKSELEKMREQVQNIE